METLMKRNANGDTWWYKNKKLHRDNNLPAFELANGDKKWFVNGQLHRDNGPAIERADGVNGNRLWFINGKHHRDDGLPAIEYDNGNNEWWVDNNRHRDGGKPAIEYDGYKAWYVNFQRHREFTAGCVGIDSFPAVEYPNGEKEWWLNDHKLTEESALSYMKFCQKMKEKRHIRAQKKIYFWWIQICYNLSRPCGQRMAQRNLALYESMVNLN